jgi:hypothetical protein
MTYPHYIPTLLATAPTTLAIGARNPEPCGLVLVEVPNGEAILRSVLVKAPHRRAGIGTTLVRAAEEALRTVGITHISGTYPAGKDSTAAVEGLLARCGWDTPTPSMYLYTLPPESAAAPRTAAWLQPHDWPAGFELVRWPDIPAEAFDEVRQRVEAGIVPAIVSPFLDPPNLAPQFSVALMRNNRMAAWAAIHQLGQMNFRCTALYAEPKTVPPGVGLHLLGHVYWQWLERCDCGDPASVTFGIHAANPFLRVFQRRILPSMPAHTCTITMSATKTLT